MSGQHILQESDTKQFNPTPADPIPNPLCNSFTGVTPDATTLSVDFDCGQEMQGRYVSLQKINSIEYLATVEVELYGLVRSKIS